MSDLRSECEVSGCKRIAVVTRSVVANAGEFDEQHYDVNLCEYHDHELIGSSGPMSMSGHGVQQ